MKIHRLLCHLLLVSACCLVGLVVMPPVQVQAQPPGQEAHVLHYREQTGKTAHTYSWKMDTQGNNVLITLVEPDATYTNLCAPDGSTLAWSMLASPHTDVRAERKAEILHVQGSFQGQPVDKQLRLGNKPWFQSVSYALGRMVALERDKASFLFLRSDKLELLAMRAELAGKKEVATTDGERVAAQRVRIKLDSLVAAFWEASYWFRLPDQVFLLYRGVNGPPGTDETVIELQAMSSAIRSAAVGAN